MMIMAKNIFKADGDGFGCDYDADYADYDDDYDDAYDALLN